MQQFIFGIDPGRHGAVAWVDESNKLQGLEEAGSADEDTPRRLFELFKQAKLVVVERPLAYPGTPAQSLVTLTESYGAAVAVARVCGVPVITPTASTWKRAVGVTSVKSTSVARATELYDLPKRTRHDKCEAALLAHFGWMQGGLYG